MAATTRTVNDKIYKPDGTPWAGARVTWRVLDFPALDTDGTVGDAIVTYTADANGEITATPTVPTSGARRYEVKRPVDGNRPAAVYIIRLAAGDAIDWRDLVAAAELTTTEDILAGVLAAYTKRANNLDDLTSAATARTNLGLGTAATAATGDFEAAGAVAAHTGAGSGAHAATAISVTPAGNLAATDVQAALEEIQGGVDGMSSDVDDLTTTTGSSTNMLRVAAAGGLEYRTTAQVLTDIGAAPTASPTFTGTVTLPTTVASIIKPASDSTSALQLANAAGTAVLTVDTVALALKTAYLTISIDGSATKLAGDAGRGIVIQPGVNAHTYIVSRAFVGGTTSPTAYMHVRGSTAAACGLRVDSGTAPTSPNAGDLWFDGTSLKFYDGTTTRTISWT